MSPVPSPLESWNPRISASWKTAGLYHCGSRGLAKLKESGTGSLGAGAELGRKAGGGSLAWLNLAGSGGVTTVISRGSEKPFGVVSRVPEVGWYDCCLLLLPQLSRWAGPPPR